MPGTRSETEHRRTSAMGVGVDGPRRHRLCQNEVVADLKKWGPSVEQISRIGMDTSKHFFQLHGVKMVAFFKALAPTVIGIEACGASHHWARILRSFGHEAKLIAPQLVKPYVKRGKNDTADAEALCAVYFHLYGVTDRDDVRYIYSTFPTVEREEMAAYGRYRSCELCLAWMSALAAGDPDAEISL